MKNKVLILKIILSIFFIIFIVNTPTVSNAGLLNEIFDSDSGANGFIKMGSSDIDNIGTLNDVQKEIFNVLFTIGIFVTVIVGGVLGIKFMLASAEDKAKIKESMMPYILGSIVIFGAFGIWGLAVLALDGLSIY